MENNEAVSIASGVHTLHPLVPPPSHVINGRDRREDRMFKVDVSKAGRDPQVDDEH